ncbi:MAG TPA: response regulator [Ktedonobacterales bacterium]|nr:response regulator [Ktedonobacterales bacterium]
MSAETSQRVWRILVVDDEENLNWSLVNSLRKEQYAADGALTGEDALRQMANQQYDIIISDVRMPGMDGFELLQWLRRHRPQTRVLMMTAFGSPTERAEATRGGVVAYIEKPFDLHALKEELRRVTTTEPARVTGAPPTDGYDLLEVARVVSLARRDIALQVEANGQRGRLRFVQGDLIWAECGALQGDEAFVTLTAPRTGRVQPEPWDGRSARNVQQPLSALIYQAMAQRDRAAGAGPQRAPTSPSRSATMPATPALHIPGAPTPPGVPPSAVASPPVSAPPTAAPSTHPFAILAPAQAEHVRATLSDLAGTLPPPAGVVLLRPDGTLLAQSWNGASEPPTGTLLHLAAGAQSAVRAMLLGGWGDVEDVRVTTRDRYVLAWRLGRAERAALLLLIVPRGADLEACAAQMREREPALSAALQ